MAALLDSPPSPYACYVLAHGAGAGMDHAFLAALAGRLCAQGVAVLRFQFPFMQQGSRRPDPPAVAQAAVRTAVEEAGKRFPGLPLFAGGKSFGARMSSQAQAASPLPGVRGLVFVGFPLHPAGKPGITRAAHLDGVHVAMLFLQGTRDALADLSLVQEVVQPLRPRATLHVVDGADHAFHVLVRSGRTDAQVLDELALAAAQWMRAQM
ncbi:alpha/beta hydrolase [Ramlibacter sp. USB13]|uniref:Alpha/beta hydrolase n=1 Tax=Ramlibacter cellulosilyticus TaxID=2764187 RepID=A0A923SBM7_9BURK|nr:alpha/beta family hydrolase [Ramlibacter cellulosilyticus]MBC5784030.1 alpha/beta hydrolase [Ramlibacter cellulosilyticus]